MKKLSDHKGEEAIELWANILDPSVDIFGDKDIADLVREKTPTIIIAKEIVKKYPKQACDILLAIDDTPIDGLNIITRLISVITEIGKDEEIKSFFGLSAGNTEVNVSGSATENTEGDVSPDASSNI